jgi:HPt (histidine-containing phosphotransfer) domain-containing protein
MDMPLLTRDLPAKQPPFAIRRKIRMQAHHFPVGILENLIRLAAMGNPDEQQRIWQILKGVGLLLGITVVICGTLAGWGHLPDLLAEWIGFMIGIATSPFFMEVSCIVVGFVLVVSINHWRNQRDGDEFVTLPQENQNPSPRTNMPPVATPPDTPRKVMNVENFLRLSFGDVAGLGRLAREYLAEIRSLLPTWAELAAKEDFQQLREQLHRSKGSASQFGFERLAWLITETETHGFLESNRFDTELFATEINAVDEALSQVMLTFEE